ncbi:mechanosensitive ion channel family protein [Liquorilactobacillus satsumensis]|uniref:Small-conductance mechanosensitive channel n=1 Tax=Liquorilactobacillus satsumensis DSM 16230 = JCM 12392 TaxID=1423801 RepID=A0A0R1VC44_9LACO|nr:mechanosensitive ion channel family protein [Liquorilactobacillus satsumensis]KRM00563.1 small-conductance mechanosensitive channel [Liquorilactobacillus satsumensis DSM 16230 = JCM 12392]
MQPSYLIITASQDIATQVTRQTNLVTTYLAKINWEDIFGKILTTFLSLVLLSLFFFLINWLGKIIIRRGFKKTRRSDHLSSNRLNTIFTLSLNIFHYCVLFFYFYAILSAIGIPVGTLLAGVGIASVALGLGAQGFVTDVVTGFFILLEQQFDVGDEVKIGKISGTIRAIGLRTTQITDYDGTLHYVPNRNITIVSNLSRNDMRALVDIYFDPSSDIQKMSAIIREVNHDLAPKFTEITQGPTLLGTIESPNGSLCLRVVIYTKNGAQFNIQRTFLAAYLKELNQAGFKLKNSPLNLTTTP